MMHLLVTNGTNYFKLISLVMSDFTIYICMYAYERSKYVWICVYLNCAGRVRVREGAQKMP